MNPVGADLEVIEVSIVPVAPVQTSRGAITSRPALLVELTDAAGHRGCGELAPLEGWSGVNLTQARAQLQAWDLEGRLASGRTGALAELDPQVRASIDAARWMLEADTRGMALWQLLAQGRPGRERHDGRVPVNALVGAPTASLARDVGGALDRGFRVLKVKMGFDDDLDRLVILDAAVPLDARVRLDPNGAWDRQRAADLSRAGLERLGDRLEYVEDPVADLDALAELRASVPVPIAVDELARTPGDRQRVLADELAEVVVIKPALQGGITATLEAGESLSRGGIDVVVSSLHDGPVGLLAWLHLAAVQPGWRAHGLAPMSVMTGHPSRCDPAALRVVGGEVVLAN